MSLNKIKAILNEKVASLRSSGAAKGNELVITGIVDAHDGYSERYTLQGYGERGFLRLNANNYLGLSRHPRVMAAEAEAAERFGAGPGAVRFISGTWQPHVELEAELAAFHQREAAMLMSAAYATVVGVIPQFVSEDTLVISDALNHNSIINAIRLARPAAKAVYTHLDMGGLEQILTAKNSGIKRVLVVTDGIFSMRGDHAPLHELLDICRRHEDKYAEGIITIVDDSHGVGAFGTTGRGTEEYTGGVQADILIATLGKALGVNGGYVVAERTAIDYLRETAPLYIYSNPITPAEAAAARCALAILNSDEGVTMLRHLHRLATMAREGLGRLGLETIAGDHPIVPILIRDTAGTTAMVRHLFDNNILATGLNYPVVPKGDEEIRLQISAMHTEKDIEQLLSVLERFTQHT